MATPTAASLPVVNIGTRRSVLARVQTDLVCKELRKAWPERKYEIHAMATMGDKNQVTALHEFNAKALWTHELEALLEKGDLDMIVHSLKGASVLNIPVLFCPIMSCLVLSCLVLCFTVLPCPALHPPSPALSCLVPTCSFCAPV